MAGRKPRFSRQKKKGRPQAGRSGARRAAPAVTDARSASPWGPHGEKLERTRGARRRGGLGAPGRRAGPSSNRRLPCDSRVSGAGRQGGRAAGTQRQRSDWARVAGAASRAGLPRTIDPGGWAVARARGRRDDAIPCPGARSSEGCLQSAGASPLPAALKPAEQAGGGSVPAAGAGRARAFVCGEGAGTRSARSY